MNSNEPNTGAPPSLEDLALEVAAWLEKHGPEFEPYNYRHAEYFAFALRENIKASRASTAPAGQGEALQKLTSHLDSLIICRSCDHDYCHLAADIRAMTADAVEQTGGEILRRGAELGRLDNEIVGYREEIRRLRTRLFTTSCRKDSCDHSTACSIWGDDGQGNTVDFGSSLPCNCGALINFYKAEAAKVLDRATTPASPAPHESHVFNPRCRECLVLALDDAVFVAERDGKASLSPDTFRELLSVMRKCFRPAPEKGEVARRAAEKVDEYLLMELDDYPSDKVEAIASIIEAELRGEK